jgi:hypothetical protein
MNTQSENNDNNIDNSEEIGAIYRAFANERTPPALDRIILRNAATAAGKPRLRSMSFLPWAVAASAALCLALVIEISREPELQPASAPLGSAEEAKTPRQLSTAALQTEANRQRSDKALKGGNSDGMAAKLSGPVRADEGPGATQSNGAGFCAAQAKSSATTWLACIRELEQAGEAAAARSEREALQTAFPAFIDDAE